MTNKKLADYIEKSMNDPHYPSNNVSISLGELPKKTVAYLKTKFKVSRRDGFLGYWHFERLDSKKLLKSKEAHHD